MKLSSIMKNEALEYAIYTIENRAIASIVDGLKPVQRFVLYSAIKNAKDYTKIASFAGRVSEYGYHHGEVSAGEAAKLMASDWSNNIPLLQGRGNFGSRMIQESAAVRYVFAKIHDNFELYFKDLAIAPEHKDKDHLPPMFYVPVIPMVLANGVEGIATGFASKILPHDPKWIIAATKAALKGVEIPEPVIKLPMFDGEVVKEDDQKYTVNGNFTVSGYTVTITDIPVKYDHLSYLQVLNDLQEANKIVSYADNTSDKFHYVVKLKRGTDVSRDGITKLLKLSSSYTQNINVLDPQGKIKHYDDARELVKDFVAYRLTFLTNRISMGISKSIEKMLLADAKVKFIDLVVNEELKLHTMSKHDTIKLLQSYEWSKDYAQDLVSMSFDKLTTDERDRLLKEAKACHAEVNYWKSTTEEKEFIKDLSAL